MNPQSEKTIVEALTNISNNLSMLRQLKEQEIAIRMGNVTQVSFKDLSHEHQMQMATKLGIPVEAVTGVAATGVGKLPASSAKEKVKPTATPAQYVEQTVSNVDKEKTDDGN